MGKSASHSRITENISALRNRWHVQTAAEREKKAERHHSQHICIQTHARTHTLAGRGEIFLPEEGGERKTGWGWGGGTRRTVEGRLHRSRLIPELSPGTLCYRA